MSGRVLVVDLVILMMMGAVASGVVYWRHGKRVLPSTPAQIAQQAIDIRARIDALANDGEPLEPLALNWDLARVQADMCGVDLVGVVLNAKNAGAVKVPYEGPRGAWHGVLKGKNEDVLLCAAQIQRIVPMVIGVFTPGGMLSVSILGLADEQSKE